MDPLGGILNFQVNLPRWKYAAYLGVLAITEHKIKNAHT